MTFQRFVEISKVDAEKRMVYGYASTEALDKQGERVAKDAIEKALPEYMRYANIREMHQPSAVGIAKEADIDEKGLYLGVKVVDESAWTKVKEGVYKGFSIGGSRLTKTGDLITGLKLTEISLVDRPANPEAVFEMWKSDASEPEQADEEKAVDELAKLIDGGTVKPSELVAMIKKAQEVLPASTEQPAAEVPAAAVAENATTEIAKTEDATKGDAPAAPNAQELAAEVKKGLYDVCQVAQIVNALAMAVQVARSEARVEGDASSVPNALQDALRAVASAFKQMAAEETDECVADASKADQPDDLTKAQTKLSKVEEELAATQATLTNSTAELAELKKRLEAVEKQPQLGKAFLRAVSKSQDVVHDDSPDAEALAKAEALRISKLSPEEQAKELIRKVHQTGGVPIGRV